MLLKKQKNNKKNKTQPH